jgi:hypothetical protein
LVVKKLDCLYSLFEALIRRNLVKNVYPANYSAKKTQKKVKKVKKNLKVIQLGI